MYNYADCYGSKCFIGHSITLCLLFYSNLWLCNVRYRALCWRLVFQFVVLFKKWRLLGRSESLGKISFCCLCCLCTFLVSCCFLAATRHLAPLFSLLPASMHSLTSEPESWSWPTVHRKQKPNQLPSSPVSSECDKERASQTTMCRRCFWNLDWLISGYLVLSFQDYITFIFSADQKW